MGDRHPRATPAAGARTGARIAQAWAAGTLLDRSPTTTAPGDPRAATVRLAGVGETFAAWHLSGPGSPSLIVRVPHGDPTALPRPVAHEVGALGLLPPGIGPRAVALQPEAEGSPLGLPYIVTTAVPGRALAPSAWTTDHLNAHARLLARLHGVPAPGRVAATGPARSSSAGPAGTRPAASGSTGAGDAGSSAAWGTPPAGPPRLLPEVEAEVVRWRAALSDRPDHGLEPYLEATLRRVEAVDPEIAELGGQLVLSHGDLCATNIIWADGAPEGPDPVRYIDFEWAQGDDPARDLAILGGAVHGGPWFVPFDEAKVDLLVRTYVGARRDGGTATPAVTDLAALRRRMQAWTAYDRTSLLVHLHAGDRSDPATRAARADLRRTLAVDLALPS